MNRARGADHAPWRTRLRRVTLILLVGSIVVAPMVTTPLELTRLSRVMCLALAVLGVNLLTGYSGLISLGHGVFIGIGAFAMANFVDLGLPLAVAVIAATALAGAAGIVLGLPALRVKGIYLALITFGIALAFSPLAGRLGRLTGGGTGRTVDNSGFAPPSVLGLDDQTHIWRYGICLVVILSWFLVARNLVHSRVGRSIRSIRDNEYAATSFGVDVTVTKTGTLAISAAMAGTTGAMQALLNPYISHTDFDAMLSLRLYASAVVGGLGTLLGAILGVVVLVVVPLVSRLGGVLTNESILFGASMLIITYVAPAGLAGFLRTSRSGNKEPG